MVAIRSVVRRSDSQGSQLLQHGYLIALAVIIIFLVILRIFVLRWRNRTAHDFFRMGSGSQYTHSSLPQNNPNSNSEYRGAQLTPLPAAYHSDRRVCSADTDVFGRRLGAVGTEWSGKDALPAYDSLDRPPKYIEAGWLLGELPHSTGQSAMVLSHEREQGRTVYPNTINGAPGGNSDQHFGDTHA